MNKPDWRKNIHWLPMSKPGSWLFSKIMRTIDRFVFWLSGGQIIATGAIAGLPTLMLTTTGAKSGLPRTQPLVGIPDGKNFILIASNWGQKHNPAWYYNLKARPEVKVEKNGKTENYTAHELQGSEYERCWNLATSCYKGYDSYKARAGRHIPVFVLEPIQ